MRVVALLSLVLVACTKSAAPKSFECADCHREQVDAWKTSHHARGQQVADGGYTWRDDAGVHVAPIRFTIGVEPVQQFVVEVAPGKLQIAPTVPTTLTGPAGDWRGPRFHWAGSCASCHATGFQVNAMTWKSLSVSCDACHVGVEGHRAWLDGGTGSFAGFASSLKRKNVFEFVDGGAIAKPRELHADSQTMTCAQCHQRRRALVDDGAPVTQFFDAFEPELMRRGAFEPNGAMVDEVFESASFLMSKMQRAGVRCSHCHEPHSGALRAKGNALCAQCHQPSVFDTTAHRGTSTCVECHMPSRTFLGSDERRDHAFIVPGRSAPAFAAAFAGNADANAQLISVIGDVNESSFKRASALALLEAPVDEATLKVIAAQLSSDDDWLRFGAVSALPIVPPRLRSKWGEAMLSDERRAIRVRAARALGRETADLVTAERANSFSGDSWLNLGAVAQSRSEAEARYRRGLATDPFFVPLSINLADVTGDEALLVEAASWDTPWRSDAAYALGLSLWRRGEKKRALASFRDSLDGGGAAQRLAWCLAEREVNGVDAGCSTGPSP